MFPTVLKSSYSQQTGKQDTFTLAVFASSQQKNKFASYAKKNL